MNYQETFEKMLTHLRTQGKKAATSNGCLYRHNGLKCAIGCLIPDEEYDKNMEGRIPFLLSETTGTTENDSWNNKVAIAAGAKTEKDCLFLRDAQEHLHDGLTNDLSGLEQSAKKFAENFSLTYPEPKHGN